MLSLNINFVLCINCILFFIGLLGIVLNRKNILTIIMSIELLLLAVNLNFGSGNKSNCETKKENDQNQYSKQVQ